jgi:membrane protease YdiL (CAAX protease family)
MNTNYGVYVYGIGLLLGLVSIIALMSRGLLLSYVKPNGKSFFHSSIYCLPIIIVLLSLYLLGWYPKGDLGYLNRGMPYPLFPIVYMLIIVPIQQIFFFIYIPKVLIPKYSVVLRYSIIVLCYASIHLYYPQPWIIWGATLILGFIWYYVANKTQSIWGNMIYHTIIGIIAFALNFA